MKYFSLILIIGLLSCGGNKSSDDAKKISDLPFDKAQDAKSYADIILKSIRTDRDLPVWHQFADKTKVNKDSLHLIASMYSTGIRGRKDWEYIDVYGDGSKKNDKGEFNYAWLDQSGRLGIQIKIVPISTANGFDLDRIEFRSRLDVMESKAFPGSTISNYEKLDYDWDAKMKRKVKEESRK